MRERKAARCGSPGDGNHPRANNAHPCTMQQCSPRYVYKLTVVSLQPATLGEEVRSTSLDGTRAKGITSVKFSPSLRHLLIGPVKRH